MSHHVIHGDTFTFLQGLPDESVHMVFADPPYNLSNGGYTVSGGTRVPVDKGQWDRSAGVEADFDFHQRWITETWRVLQPGGTLWITGTYHSIYACGYATQLAGFRILNDIVWYKPNASPNLACRMFTASHETILWARKGDTPHTFNYTEMKDGHWAGDPLKADGKQMRTVWQIPAPGPGEKTFGKHPTQKPVALLNRIITASTNPGDLIADPFTGSGTTGVVAAALGRNFIGVDADADYVALARRRIAAAAAAAPAPGTVTPGKFGADLYNPPGGTPTLF